MTRALVGNAADQKQVRGAKKKEKEIGIGRAQDLHAVMSTLEGRRFVWWLLGECGVSATVMRGGPDLVEYNAGKQDIAHMLQARIIKLDPDNYLAMQNEAIVIEKQKQREDDAADEIEESARSDSLGDPEE
jgi:hypothetical protein